MYSDDNFELCRDSIPILAPGPCWDSITILDPTVALTLALP